MSETIVTTETSTPPLTGTAAHILTSAVTVFVRNGYAGTTIGDIARESDVTRPTVYAYFDSKEDIFRQLAEQVRQEFLALQHVDPSLSVEEVIEVADRQYLRSYVTHERLLTVIKHQAIGNPSMGELWRDIHHLSNQRHQRYVEAQLKLGNVKPVVPPKSVAEITTGMVSRFSELLQTEPERFEDLLADLVSAHLALLGL